MSTSRSSRHSKGQAVKTLRSDEERNRLVEANMGLAGAVVRRFWRSNDIARRLGFNVCYSECYFVLLKAAAGWDESKGIQFSTYATCAMIKGMLRMLEYQSKRLAQKSLDVEISTWVPGARDKRPVFDQDEMSNVSRIISALPAKDQWVLRLFRQGWVGEQIAQVLGMSKQNVSLIRRRAIAKVQRGLQSEVYPS
jgi:RNA polymerase sigma factor (sigma-70 family)